MELSKRELAEATRMIQAQSKSARWLLSLGRYDSVWVLELEESGAEVLVRYSGTRNAKRASNVTADVIRSSEWVARTTDPKAKRLMDKYKLFTPKVKESSWNARNTT